MTSVPIDSLRLHPAAEKVPMASGEDLAALDASLRENGQQDPIDVTPDGLILDGRTRWTLLQKQGATTIQTRIVDMPEAQQTAYIIGRALERRHLTMAQKQALNALMASQVIEEVQHPETGEVMRIGLGQAQRAAKLGIERQTVTQWDKEADVRNLTAAPTHQRLATGRIEPLHKERREPAPKARSNGQGHRGQKPVAHGRKKPLWLRDFTLWCKWARPEDKGVLLDLDAKLHAALAMNGIECEHSREA